MTNAELLEWAKDHGYQHRRCHACGAHWWTDTNEEYPKCGGAKETDEDNTKPIGDHNG